MKAMPAEPEIVTRKGNPVSILICKLCVVFAVSTSVAALKVSAEGGYTKWMSGSGDWTDAPRWSEGLPDPYKHVEIHGTGTVRVPPGAYPIANLQIGKHCGDHTRVEVDGGKVVLVQDPLDVGDVTGSEGELILKDGALHNCVDTYVGGGAAAPGRATRGTFVIQGGSYLGRTLVLGTGWGAQSLLGIEGSRPSAIHVLQYFYLTSHADSDGTPGVATLSFTLDEHGVTPITIQSTHDGLRIIKDAKSHCRLQLALKTIPPREDITLVATHVPVKGTFDDLPEGAEVTAEYEKKLYRWQLTYQGGASGHDLVLKNRSEYDSNAPVTHVRPMPEVPKPLWVEYPLCAPFAPTNAAPAFPGAEGFGAFTPGGRGGRIIEVTNLHDSGPGSLRAAVTTPGPRIVVFKVGGVIPLKSTLRIEQPFITIDGQNAPGPGILLRDFGIEVQTHDVVLRYLRVRVGDDNVHLDAPGAREVYYGGGGEHALYFIEGSKNCIADHLSLSWSTTKVLTVTKMSDLITVQWCILSEGLNFADHGLGVALGTQGRLTLHHNLFAHNQGRNPRFGTLVNCDFRNNVIYDWGDTAGCGEFDRVNYIGNCLKPGPSTRRAMRLFHDGVDVIMPHSLYLADNVLDGNDSVNRDNWLGVGYDRATYRASEPFAVPPVATEQARDAYEHVLKSAGATLPRRDAVDERIVNETGNGSGHVIKWVKDAGGWPDFPSSQ
ncbi:MAG: hypothetical protein HZA90_15275 [Verrucomicrobia bacterium]|nr:hypothetical protein [Verrucomicrobiota bacterium]